MGESCWEFPGRRRQFVLLDSGIDEPAGGSYSGVVVGDRRRSAAEQHNVPVQAYYAEYVVAFAAVCVGDEFRYSYVDAHDVGDAVCAARAAMLFPDGKPGNSKY